MTRKIRWLTKFLRVFRKTENWIAFQMNAFVKFLRFITTVNRNQIFFRKSMQTFQINSIKTAMSMFLAAQKVLSSDNRLDCWKNMEPQDTILSSEASLQFLTRETEKVVSHTVIPLIIPSGLHERALFKTN